MPVPDGPLSEQYILNACYDPTNNKLASNLHTSSTTSRNTLTELTAQEILNLIFVADDPTYGNHLRIF